MEMHHSGLVTASMNTIHGHKLEVVVVVACSTDSDGVTAC